MRLIQIYSLIPLMKRFKSQAGMTLGEAAIGIGLLSSLTVVGSMVTIMVFDNMRKAEFEADRKELQRDISTAARSPRSLRQSLEGTPGMLDCVKIDSSGEFTSRCTQTSGLQGFSIQYGGRALTNDQGYGCYSTKGVRCADPSNGICPSSCPVRMSASYRVTCIGGSTGPNGQGAGTRANCPANQASIIVNYELKPEETTAGPKDRFRPISATAVVPPSSLWGDPSQLPEGAAAVELTSAVTRSVKRCANGQIMQGLDSSGEPICINLTEPSRQCDPGELLTGYKVENGTLVADCKQATCPPGQYFNGFDPVTGNVVCKALTGGTCNMGTVAAPGRFTVGIDLNTATPICNVKACPTGFIYAGLDSSTGNARCYSLNWVPKCGAPGNNCSTPPSAAPPPMPGTFYTALTTPAVSLGYNGPPFFTAWSDGRPTEAYHMTFLSRTGSASANPNVTVNLGDPLSPASTSRTCAIQSPLNDLNFHKCAHTWLRITRAVGNCSAEQTFVPPNDCRWTATGVFAEVSEQFTSESDPLYSPTSFNAVTGAVSCAGAATSHIGVGNIGAPTGLPVNSRYNETYQASVAVACNYRYTGGAIGSEYNP